jgi:PPE-repeat protein
MTAPVWMALPPEVHSALLSSGPGAGPLLAAAGTWSALSTEYDAAATELSAVLAGAQQVWGGSTADQYLAAHLPYLSWLRLASAVSAETAGQHETVAAGYTAALAAMPTLAELATNHAVHAVLVATNFFGINTIPIALNEADYTRMWVQAATTMSTYQATAEAAQAGSGGGGGGGGQGAGGGSFQLPTPAEIWQMIFGPDGEQFPGQGQPNWDPSQYLQNLPNLVQGNQQALIWLQQNWQGLTNPSQFPQLISYFIAWQTFRVVNWTLRTLRFLVQELPLLLPAVLNLAVLNLGAATGVAGLAAPVSLAGLSGSAQPAATPAVTAPTAPTAPVALPTQVTANTPVLTTTPTATTTSVPAPTPSVASTTAVPPAPGVPPPLADAQGFGYLVGIGYIDSPEQARTKAKAKAPIDDIAAAAPVTLLTPPEARARRHLRSVIDRGYRYEFLDADDESGADPAGSVPQRYAASDRGTGPMGFAGTVHKGTTTEAAGLSTLAGDEFGGGPRMPMLPGTWDPETPR